MRYIIDLDKRVLTSEDGGEVKESELYSPEALATVGRLWMTVGWAQRYSYRFTWLGRPIIQLPDDILRYQEVVYRVKPDVIVETGVAHGGSLVLSASLCKLLGKGHVIGVDIEIRPKNRTAIEHHELAGLITLIEGGSTDVAVVEQVKSLINPNDRVMVVLDSNHSKAHVLAELAAYAPLVTPGSYIIAADGVMRDLTNVPGGSLDWEWNNPAAAAAEFAAASTSFVIDPPPPVFDESRVLGDVTYWPSGWLRRKRIDEC